MIRLEHVTKTFGAVTAVHDLSLHVPPGELFCFIGPNGAGKTTTIKLLTGLLHPSSGRLFINGIDIVDDPLPAKQILGYIPDMPYLYDRLTPVEFFEFTGDLYRIGQTRIAEAREHWFDLLGLQDYRHRLIRDLSHGMRQRLLYAAMFLHEPRVAFIDEPLIGLDPYTIRLIKDVLREKVRAGMTIFLTTHILALAEDIADRIAIIAEGSLIALGTLQELSEKSSTMGPLEDVFLELTGGARRETGDARNG